MARRAAEADDARVATSSVQDTETPDDHTLSQTEVILTRAELARAAGITDDELGQLEEYGLIAPTHTSRDRVLFDDDALVIARVAVEFMRHGIEARHLRMYRAFAEREAGLFEQVLLPYRRQRNPEAQARTHETLGELSGSGPAAAYRVAAPGRPSLAHGLTCPPRSCSTPMPSRCTSPGSAVRSSAITPRAWCSSES